MAVTSRLQTEAFDAAAELDAFLKGRTEEDGAVVSFVGLARGHATGGGVERLGLKSGCDGHF